MKFPACCCALLAWSVVLPGPLLADILTDTAMQAVEKTVQAVHPDRNVTLSPVVTPSGQTALTLGDALAIALRDNLGMASRSAQLQSKEAAATASFRKMLPTLSLSSARSDVMLNTARGGIATETFSTSTTLTQPIYRGQALWSGWKSSEVQRDQAKLDLIHGARALIRDVKTAWYGLLEKKLLFKEAAESLNRLHQHEANARSFFREGRIWRNELLQANVRVAQGEQALIIAQNQVELARSELNRLMRRPMDHPLDTQGELSVEPMEWTLEDAYAHAKEHRADLERARLDIQVGELSETTAASATLPQVNLNLVHKLDSPDLNYRENDASVTATLVMNWTAWNWGQTSQEVASAKAVTAKNQITYDDQLQSILLETRKAFLNARESVMRVDILKKSLQQAEENYRVNQIRYQEQLGTATDVLNAMDLLTSTRNTYTSALASYLSSLAALELAAGKGAEDLELVP